ncbi:hypothetical protein KC19_5G190800 [Ceratodon purpureus]|uniref:Uncharacterized protein n=1 Tax=Ceratodon purpureus TaxID=3225 RepID=A0A8T0I475_CERPU|nr:hypothetical protein KC19_5G190800 [Ceratodon purpureus]
MLTRHCSWFPNLQGKSQLHLGLRKEFNIYGALKTSECPLAFGTFRKNFQISRFLGSLSLLGAYGGARDERESFKKKKTPKSGFPAFNQAALFTSLAQRHTLQRWP